jgi:peptidase E
LVSAHRARHLQFRGPETGQRTGRQEDGRLAGTVALPATAALAARHDGLCTLLGTLRAMAADQPTIVATSGGFVPAESPRRRLDAGPLVRLAVELSEVTGRAPRICCLGTASGDQRWVAAELDEAIRAAGWIGSHVFLFPMPNHDDVEAHLLDQDVIWVGGGSVANLLALWRLHGLASMMRRAWQAGVVLGGVSAGSICWHTGGTTDSFGPELRPVTDGLGLLPYGNGVHYDSEPGRRLLVHRLVAGGVLPTTYCSDDGVGLVYRGTELYEAVTSRAGAGAYRVERQPDGSPVEVPVTTRRLG